MTELQHQPDQLAPVEAASDDLLEVMRAYNRVSDQLRRSHDSLTAQVARLQRELASANAALQRSRRLAALGEMAAGIAHEIRNPLASIQLYVGMLIEDLGDRAEQQQIARRVAEAVRGLNAVVGDVLTFARELRLSVLPADVDALFDRAIEAVRPLIDEAGVEVDIEGESIEFNCDGDLLHQAMVNLVRNAAQAMDGAANPRLTLSAAQGAGGVTLTVRDTGPGIDQQQIDRIFNPFFTTRHTGTGLGLAIVHRIVDAHGGSITVHNDGGAVFTITLPDAPATVGVDSAVAAHAAHEVAALQRT